MTPFRRPTVGASARADRSVGFRIYQVCVVVPVLVILALTWIHAPAKFANAELAVWIVLVAFVELLPVTAWRDLHVSMGFPLLLAVAVLYSPEAAAGVALIAAIDPRELRREVSVLRAMFNRCQIALSVWVAGVVFNSLGSLRGAVFTVIGAAVAAAAADYLVNMSLVTGAGVFLYRVSPVVMIRKLRIGRLSEFLVSYLGLGVLGVIIALLYDQVGFWSVATFVAPLVLARQMFFRSVALEQAHRELQDREQVLRALSNRMAEERQDERAHIAAYLHDDLAQLLFRLSLQVDIAKRHLDMGDTDGTATDLESIRETKNRTSEKIRALIRDLHRSPLGRAGLPEAVDSFLEEVGGSAGVRFHTDVDDLPLPPPIQLLAYHIAREAVMNALRHAGARNIWVSFGEVPAADGEDAGSIDLVVRDDGAGFDPTAAAPDGHFGMAMMRERASVAGGSFEVSSDPAGTTVMVRFPTSWLQEAPEEEPLQGAEPVPEHRPAAETVPA